MNKVIEHLKNNSALYLIFVVVLIIIAILVFNPNTNKKTLDYDTSMFNVIDNKKALELFERKEPSILFIGRKTCSASSEMIPNMQIALAKYGFEVNYLELTDLDKESDEYKKLVELLNFEYTNDGVTKPFGEFIGITPMFIVLKDGEMVFGYLGIMSTEVIGTVAKQYGVAQNE